MEQVGPQQKKQKTKIKKLLHLASCREKIEAKKKNARSVAFDGGEMVFFFVGSLFTVGWIGRMMMVGVFRSLLRRSHCSVAKCFPPCRTMGAMDGQGRWSNKKKEGTTLLQAP